MKTFKLLLLFFIFIYLGGCAAVTVSKSEFDNSTHIVSKPGGAGKGIALSASWNSTMPKDTARLDVCNYNGGVGEGNSFHLNIDGAIYDLEAYPGSAQVKYNKPIYIGAQVAYPGKIYNIKSYPISVEVLKKMVNSKKTVFRVDTSPNEFVESILEERSFAVENLKEFISAYNHFESSANK